VFRWESVKLQLSRNESISFLCGPEKEDSSLRILFVYYKLPIRVLSFLLNSLKGYIVQDSCDIVDWSNYKATFYTNPPKRKEIDKLIKQNK